MFGFFAGVYHWFPKITGALLREGLGKLQLTLLFVGTNRGPGGTESHLVSLAIAMANAGYEVAAVVRPDDVIARALALDGRIELYEAAFERSYDRRATLDVARACRAVHPDWMIGSFAREFWPLALVARTRRIPLALFLHVQRISRLSAPLFPWLASRFILPSEYLREWVVARRGMPRWRTRVLYNPIDVARFRPNPAMREATRRRFGRRDEARPYLSVAGNRFRS